MKRDNYIGWDELFIGIAELTSKRSKDPSTQNGACIVKDKKVLSIGYNGLPYGLNDLGLDVRSEFADGLYPKSGFIYDYWEKPIKYDLVIHAESNAILNANTNMNDSIMYLYSEKGYYPCSKCAGMISQVGIKEIIMKTAIKENTEAYNWDVSRHILKQAGIAIRILYPYV